MSRDRKALCLVVAGAAAVAFLAALHLAPSAWNVCAGEVNRVFNVAAAWLACAALFGAAATTIGGFGILTLSILPPMAQFGIVTALSILYSFLASVFVLPSFLALWARWKFGKDDEAGRMCEVKEGPEGETQEEPIEEASEGPSEGGLEPQAPTE